MLYAKKYHESNHRPFYIWSFPCKVLSAHTQSLTAFSETRLDVRVFRLKEKHFINFVVDRLHPCFSVLACTPSSDEGSWPLTRWDEMRLSSTLWRVLVNLKRCGWVLCSKCWWSVMLFGRRWKTRKISWLSKGFWIYAYWMNEWKFVQCNHDVVRSCWCDLVEGMKYILIAWRALSVVFLQI